MVIVLKVPLLMIMIFLLFYNMASKLVQFQSRNLLISLACPIILWRHADGAMNLLKIMHICKLVRDNIIGSWLECVHQVMDAPQK